MMVRLARPTSGRILFDGKDLASLSRRQLAAFHSDAQVVFQNPYQSLNPRLRVGTAIGEVLKVWKRREHVQERSVAELLTMVHLPPEYARKYPHELSGGERQRVAIARAMAVQPRFIVADEPVSSLDVSAAARVVNLLLELREKADLTCVFITHDIGLARLIADRIAVMFRGRIVDLGSPDDVFERPTDDYTKALIAAQLHVPTEAERESAAARL
jgi:peptide/nickel transport system ATP-binding protein